ncbi:hypothetical protein [Paludisphaera sp.]|uniref:tetratricopeptide repeat protein n=1 Tax=Paludisphaera sp. TaxID=2017432 RepID=UPI00301C3D16
MGSNRCAGAARAALLGFTSAALAIVSGCSYQAPTKTASNQGSYTPGASLSKVTGKSGSASRRDAIQRAAILESSIELIKGAALKPGGDNFRLATQKLNQFFEGTPPAEYVVRNETLRFLARQLPRKMMEEVQSSKWSETRDARHLEDCMLYSDIAGRVAGAGDDLTRVRRVFDWLTKQVQLVPVGALGTPGLPQVYARPYDVLFRGMGSESQGAWAERSWTFMALCRQLGVDVGLLTFTRGNAVEPLIPKTGDPLSPFGPARESQSPQTWICAALVDGEAYLFDARAGLPVPGPGGEGVATLRQALGDPAILEAMNVPGLSPYDVSRATLLASTTKIGVLIDSSQGYFTPKMRLLQGELAGKNRTVLYHDPAAQEASFAEVLGDRLGYVMFWTVPLEVETLLFTDPQFVAATQQSLLFFRGEMPLIYARLKHLRGEFAEAVSDYVGFRFSETQAFVTNKDVNIPDALQQGLDAYATYYLALAHLEREDFRQAELMFTKTLEILPEPTSQDPPYFMFRWGAHANLGRIYEAQGDYPAAVAHYLAADPTMQRHGNLLRARALVLEDPMQAVPDPLPAAPEQFSRVNAPKPEAQPEAVQEPGNPEAPAAPEVPKGADVLE